VRLLIVTHNFPRTADDFAGAFLLDLARGQRALGHDVCVIAPHAAGLAMREVLDGIEVRRWRYAADADETLAYAGTMADQVMRSWAARVRFVRFLAAMRAAARAAVRDWHPDVVHVHWWFPGGLATWPWRGGARPPLVVTSHGTDLFLADRKASLRWLARRVLPDADAVTVISTPLVARARALGVDAARLTVCPMPVRDADGAPPPRAPVAGRLLFLGRLTARKGADVAVRALATLRETHPHATLRIVGDGPERPALEGLVQALGLAGSVTFAGRVSTSAVAAEYAAAEAFVMPARTDWKGEQEGFGLVLVEALRARCPVVATRSGGIPDVIRDGETGRLVPEDDPAALAAALRELLDAPAEAARLGAAGHDDVATRFAADAIARTFDAVYHAARARGRAAAVRPAAA
jgi:glycosyltransferase involved in cell wall biosynthesis